MGEIVGAAIVSHHPGLMQPEAVRVELGAGRDSDLIAGFGRVRARMDALGADTLVIFDTHWITTNFHLVAGAAHFKGTYTSDEMPFSLPSVPYDYPGAPLLARLVETVARERGVPARSAESPNMALHYPTLDVLAFVHRGERVLSVGACQTAAVHHYLAMGEALGEAIRRSDSRVVLLASGALSHRMTDFDFKPRHPRAWHPDNVHSPELVAFDQEILALFEAGDHAAALDRYPEMRAARYEGFGSHYVQMLGALGGRACRARGTRLSEYEAARGTGNIHVWFDVH